MDAGEQARREEEALRSGDAIEIHFSPTVPGCVSTTGAPPPGLKEEEEEEEEEEGEEEEVYEPSKSPKLVILHEPFGDDEDDDEDEDEYGFIVSFLRLYWR
jgi:hypothetical protein